MAKEPKVATDTKIKGLLADKTGFNNISVADFKKLLKILKLPPSSSDKGYTVAQVKDALRTATPSAVRDAVSSPVSEAEPSKKSKPYDGKRLPPRRESSSKMAGTYGDLKKGLNSSKMTGTYDDLKKSYNTSVYDDLKEGLKTRKKSGAKDSAEGASAEKKETFGQRFNTERKAAKKRGDELTHVFTYKGKKYNTRIASEEKPKTRVLKQEGTGKGKKGRVEVSKLKANRGALVSRQRKGHTDLRKGGLFK